MHIKKGDLVKVISGKEKGKSGKVLEIDREKMRARVEGLMIVKRHVGRGRMASAPEGGIIEKPSTIHVSNLMLVDPKTGEPTRTRRSVVDGKKVRVSVRSDEAIE
ncbi:MAG TPA: 50S ribosomal protein L24 [Vulgatibacter sp.]|nr:50S ribosomal protein L24 [Vulgatibacter sp.]